MTDTLRLALPRLDAAQAQKHVTHNEALAILDGVVQLALDAVEVTVPPAAPTAGMRVLVGQGATGLFAGHAGQIAAYDDAGWRFLVPRAGWRAQVLADGRTACFDGADWSYAPLYQGPPETLPQLGIGTAADANNAFAVRADNALFTARDPGDGGGDLRLKLNKAADGKTVSQLYQSNWSGRAETGLMGDDQFRIKVSADGQAWHDALVVDPATGKVSFPGGLEGASASTILSGEGVPKNSAGADGDYWLDRAATQLYGPKAGGVWPAPLSLGGMTFRRLEVFSTSGRFNKRPGDQFYRIVVTGGGGGGGGGSRLPPNTSGIGPTGGWPGYTNDVWRPASDFDASVTVIVGAGGAGGADQGAVQTAMVGTNGVAGGASQFGSDVWAPGGERGFGAGLSSAAPTTPYELMHGSVGIGIRGPGGNAGMSYFASGGGAGAGLTGAATGYAGGSGGPASVWHAASAALVAAGGAAGADGRDGGRASPGTQGGGGGGGGSALSGRAGAGGRGGTPGGGGGGGGCGVSGMTGGSGGEGGAGEVRVYVFG